MIALIFSQEIINRLEQELKISEKSNNFRDHHMIANFSSKSVHV